MSDKIDLKKTLDSYRAPRGRFEIITVPPQRYLSVHGHGDPNTSADYTDALAGLYPIAYALKFASRRELGRDYVVPPLEGLWWADDMDAFTVARDKSQWEWRMMILVPQWIPDDMVDAARSAAIAKAPHSRADDVQLRELSEGVCVQTLHVGSFDDEAPVLHRLHHEFVPQNGLRMTGTHHEIYLSDPRRTAPEKLRTILRQSVVRI